MLRNKTAWILLSLVGQLGCSEYQYTSERRKDVFQQNRMNTVDILMVVDNSCSMVEEQDKLASNFDAFIEAFAGIEVDWQIAVTTTDTLDEEQSGHFLGGTDELLLVNADGDTVDQVAWDRSWPIVEGASMQLDPSYVADSDNLDMDGWCVATAAYGSGDLGSPGAENEACAAARPRPPRALPTPPPEGDSADAVAPSVGDLVITEFMPNPSAVADDAGEWLEITNVTESVIDLSGCTLEDEGRNSYAFTEGTMIGAGEVLVLARTTDDGSNGGVGATLALGEDLTLNNSDLILTSDMDGADEIFAELVAVGTGGSGIEMGLEGARLALSEPLLSTDNAGFLRDEANLSIIVLSDEEDSSPYSTHDYLRFFTELKGEEAYRDHGMMTISGVVGKDEPPYDGAASCESSNGAAAYGSRYVSVVERTDGVLESICDEDFSPIAAELGLLASGLELVFVLAEPADPEGLTVKLYSERDEDSLLRELERDVDYTFDAEENAIVFDAAHVPPSETYLVVEYRVLPMGASVEEGA